MSRGLGDVYKRQVLGVFGNLIHLWHIYLSMSVSISTSTSIPITTSKSISIPTSTSIPIPTYISISASIPTSHRAIDIFIYMEDW